MNWIKCFNTEVENVQNKAYEACSDIFENVEAYCEEVVNFLVELEVNKKCSEDNLNIEEYIEKNSDVIEKLEKLKTEYDISFNNYVKIIRKELLNIVNKCGIYANSRKDIILLSKRAGITEARIINQILSFIRLQIDDTTSQISLLIQNRETLIEYENTDKVENENTVGYENSILEDDIIEVNRQKYEIYKIFKYKEMEKLALNNGYKYKWASGSHRVYEHSESKKIIVIPSHELGYGLSRKIQKQIYTNIA